MKRKSKLLHIAIPIMIVLAGLVLYEYGIANLYRRADELNEQQAIKMKTLEKYAALIAQKPLLEKQIIQLKQDRNNEETKMMAAQTIPIAAANLQNSVKGIITARGGVINTERVEKAEEEGKFKVISVTVDAVFPDIRILSDTLLAIETQTPYLVVKELDVRVRNFTNPRDLLVKLRVAALAGQ